MLHVADDVDAPILRILLLELDAAEGNANLDFITVRREMPFRLVDEVGAEIDRRRPGRSNVVPRAQDPFGDRAVLLHAERIDAKGNRMPTVNERREDDLDIVVAADLVPVGQGGVDGPMGLERTDSKVDRRRAVPD